MMPDVMQMTHSYCSCCLALSGGGFCGGGGHPANEPLLKSAFYIWVLIHFLHTKVMHFYETASKCTKKRNSDSLRNSSPETNTEDHPWGADGRPGNLPLLTFWKEPQQPGARSIQENLGSI